MKVAGRQGGLWAAESGSNQKPPDGRVSEGPLGVVSEDRNGMRTERLPNTFNETMGAVRRERSQGALPRRLRERHITECAMPGATTNMSFANGV